MNNILCAFKICIRSMYFGNRERINYDSGKVQVSTGRSYCICLDHGDKLNIIYTMRTIWEFKNYPWNGFRSKHVNRFSLLGTFSSIIQMPQKTISNNIVFCKNKNFFTYFTICNHCSESETCFIVKKIAFVFFQKLFRNIYNNRLYMHFFKSNFVKTLNDPETNWLRRFLKFFKCSCYVTISLLL